MRAAEPVFTPPVRFAARWVLRTQIEDATGAAIKAIQCIELTSQRHGGSSQGR